MIRDRGAKKWTAMMLSEHVVELKKWIEQDHSIERPELNEWDLQAIQDELELAFRKKCETLIKIWDKGRVISYQGIVEEMDFQKMCIILQDPFGLETIAVEGIINVQSME